MVWVVVCATDTAESSGNELSGRHRLAPQFSCNSLSYQPYVGSDAHLPRWKEVAKAVRILKRVYSERVRGLEHTVGRMLYCEEAVDEEGEGNTTRY